MQTHLLDCISDVRACQCEVLKSAHKTPVLCRVGDGESICRRKLASRLGGSCGGVAILHASLGKKFQGIFALGEKKPDAVLSDSNAEEVVDVAEVCHRKFLVKRRSDVVHQERCRRGEDDTIHVEKQVSCCRAATKDE